MSEYQYYEFQTIDRPLTKAEQQAVSQLSSRVQLSSTRAIFTYSYGDFPGDPKQVLTKYFDAMFYMANWGTLQLMFRFPKFLVDLEKMQIYCLEDCIAVSETKDFAILEIFFDNEEGFGWIEGEGYLSNLMGLRQEILQGDYRLLYLAWLKAITCLDLDEEDFEPFVPPGLGKLSPPLQAFVDTFEVDEYLLQAATTASATSPLISEEMFEQAIEQLSRSESDTFLLRLVQGEPNLSLKLRQRLSEIIDITQPKNQTQRTIQQLLESAKQEQKQAEQRKKQEAEVKRIKELEALAQQETVVWETVDKLIQKGQAKTYDEAVQLLLKLRDLAAYQNQPSNFQTQISQIHAKYSSRSGLKKRLLQFNLDKE